MEIIIPGRSSRHLAKRTFHRSVQQADIAHPDNGRETSDRTNQHTRRPEHRR